MVTKRLNWILVVVALVAMACSGGERPALDDTAVSGGSPTPTPEAPDDESDVDASAVEAAPTPVADETAVETESPDDEAAVEDETPTDAPPAADTGPPPDPATFPSQGTASVVLADGRTYDATVGCSVLTSGNEWEFRFGGKTAADVQIEGAYDTSQPDFVIMFISGPDSLNGDDVLLSNVNGGDDLSETTSSGTEWNASIQLWSPEGQAVGAELAVTCG